MYGNDVRILLVLHYIFLFKNFYSVYSINTEESVNF